MGAKKYIVRLSEEERGMLTRVVKTGKAAAYKRQRAQILLKADENNAQGGLKDKEIAELLEIGTATVERIRKRLIEKGIEQVLEREPQTNPRSRLLDGEQEAQLIALSCSEPPEGRKRWTVRLLAGKLIELNYVESICAETVRKALKKSDQALATKSMVHTAGRERRICMWDGRNTRDIQKAL